MKAIILLLSFLFVSCVTANTGNRDLSGINEKPAQEDTITVAHALLHRKKIQTNPPPPNNTQKRPKRSLNTCLKDCHECDISCENWCY